MMSYVAVVQFLVSYALVFAVVMGVIVAALIMFWRPKHDLDEIDYIPFDLTN